MLDSGLDNKGILVPGQRKYPEKVLIISDEHRGAKISNFGSYRANLIAKMTEYDHIVELGDNVELFYIKNTPVKDYARLMDVLAGRGEAHWDKEISKKAHKLGKPEDKGNYYRVKAAISGETTFLETFAEHFPHITMHKVLGNHENVTKFRNRLDELQREYHNFEWSPEGIRIGDALFTHAHLQMSGKTDEQFPQSRLREAHNHGRWRDVFAAFEGVGYYVTQIVRSPTVAPQYMHNQLSEWATKGGFGFVHERQRHAFNMDWVKHVFFGHTHVKFTHRGADGKELDESASGVHYHNTGAMVEVTSQRPEDLGILEAELHADGKLHNIRPVRIEKDKQIYTR